MFRSSTFFIVLIAVLVMIAGYGFSAGPANNSVEEVLCTHCPKPPRPPIDVHYSHHKRPPCVNHYHSDCQYGAHPTCHHGVKVNWCDKCEYYSPKYQYHHHGHSSHWRRPHSKTVYYVKYPTSSVRYINRRHPLVTGNY
jgi:hypothetical protein